MNKLLPGEVCPGCDWHPTQCDCIARKLLPGLLITYILLTVGFWVVTEQMRRLDEGHGPESAPRAALEPSSHVMKPHEGANSIETVYKEVSLKHTSAF